MTELESNTLRIISLELSRLDAKVDARFDALTQRIEAMHDETRAFLAQLDTETTAMAARLETILAAATDGPMPPDIAASFQSEINRLKGYGVDPANPFPAA